MPSAGVRKLTALFTSDKVDTKSTQLRMQERRVQPRFTTQFRSSFSGGHEEGQGRTLDISSGGCKIESDMAVAPGATFECRLHVPGLDWPLRIDEAVVRWVEGKTFGIAFTRIRPDEQTKLDRVLSNLEKEQ